MSVKLKKMQKGRMYRKWDTERPRKHKKAFSNSVERKMAVREEETVEDRWKRLKEAITQSAVNTVGYRRGKKAKKPWVTEDMLHKMSQRRKWKSINSEEGRKKYRQLNNELKRETEKAKEMVGKRV